MSTESILWLYGPPGSGKTTLGRALADTLKERGVRASLLDDDVLRAGLGADLGNSLSDQAELERRIAQLALVLAEQGQCVIVAATSALDSQRMRVRRALASTTLHMVQLLADEKIAQKRKPKLHPAEKLAAESYEGSQGDNTLDTVAVNEKRCLAALLSLQETGELVLMTEAGQQVLPSFKQNWRLRERDQRAEQLASSPDPEPNRPKTVAERMYGRQAAKMPWYASLPIAEWSPQGLATFLISVGALLGLGVYAGTLLSKRKVTVAQDVPAAAVQTATSNVPSSSAKAKSATATLLQDLVAPAQTDNGKSAAKALSPALDSVKPHPADNAKRQAILDEANTVLRTYHEAKRWEEKLPCIFDAERLRPRIQSYFERAEGEGDGAVFQQITAVQETQELNQRLLECLIPTTTGQTSRSLWMRRNPSGRLMLDWESYVGAGDMSWADLIQQKPTQRVLLRCLGELSDYYNYEFADREKYLCWRLTSPDGQKVIFAYTERKGGLAFSSSLYASTSPQKLTVKVSFPEKAQSRECVFLHEIVQPSWLVVTTSLK